MTYRCTTVLPPEQNPIRDGKPFESYLDYLDPEFLLHFGRWSFARVIQANAKVVVTKDDGTTMTYERVRET